MIASKSGHRLVATDTVSRTDGDRVERLKPKVVIFENVMGLLFKKNKTYVDKIINK
jgi:hypothetical protein